VGKYKLTRHFYKDKQNLTLTYIGCIIWNNPRILLCINFFICKIGIRVAIVENSMRVPQKLKIASLTELKSIHQRDIYTLVFTAELFHDTTVDLT
jgi:hypothetical protein